MKLANLLFFAPVLLVFLACQPDASTRSRHLGQGILVGEITPASAILQTRLTASDTLIDGELPGIGGMVRFVVSETADLDFNRMASPWMSAKNASDFIVKYQFDELDANTRYYYQVEYGSDSSQPQISRMGTFRTNAGPKIAAPISFAVVTGMNYYHFHYGKYDSTLRYTGADKALGFPALETITRFSPDYFIGTGDNVYFDHPAPGGMKGAIKKGKGALPGLFGGDLVTDEAGMRRKYHVQFVQPRFKDLFLQVGTYWEKDDHDYRLNDSYPDMDFPISHMLGIKNFKEQMPVVSPANPDAPTYRTHRLSRDVQIWLVEGRDYRSDNKMEDGPDKTLWGAEQLAWLKASLLESDATFKFLVSPTPMVGPDDAYKRDNHVNHKGFRHEGDAFFQWLGDNDFLTKNFYLICGDRHWQYHAIHPSGFEEFACGALVDANSRAGRLAGDSTSTDPGALIQQPFVQGKPEEASGGFLMVNVDTSGQAIFNFYDERGELNYRARKEAK